MSALGSLVTLLATSDLDLDVEQIADVLWLGVRQRRQDASGEREATAPEGSPGGPDDEAGQGETRSSASSASEAGGSTDSTHSSAAPLYQQAEPSGNSLTASAIALPAAPALRRPLALGRALRPFKRRVPSDQDLQVDIDRTVETSATARRLVLEFTGKPERWLDVALVVDGGASMVVWRETFQELARVLVQLGAFSNVARWGLDTNAGPDGKTVVSLRDAQERRHPPERLLRPSGRRVVLVATDAVSDEWYGREIWTALERWAAVMPTVIVQVLPRSYWASTALGQPVVDMHALRPGSPNAQLESVRAWWAEDDLEVHGDRGVALPVVHLDVEGVTNWVEALVAGTAWVEGVPSRQHRIPPSETNAYVDAGDRVAAFQARASNGAIRLARIFASAKSLTLPLMRVLQDRLAPSTSEGELAEVLVAGLLEVHHLVPGMDRFTFRPDTRELLRRGTTALEEWDVFSVVTDHLTRSTSEPSSQNMVLLVADPAGRSKLDANAEPFAELAGALALRLGVLKVSAQGDEPTPSPHQTDQQANVGDSEVSGDTDRSATGIGAGPAIETSPYSTRSSLAGSAHRTPNESLRVGEPDPSASTTITVYLRGPDPSPGRVTPEEYTASYGADAADIQALTDFSAEHGLTVGPVHVGRRCVEVSGSLGALSGAFGANLALYRSRDGEVYRAQTGDLSLPTELMGLVTGVFGLDERPQAEPYVSRAYESPTTPYTPPQVASAYNFPTSASGKGQCVAIIALGGGFRADELSSYFVSLGVSLPTIEAVSIRGASNQADGPDQRGGRSTAASETIMMGIEVLGSIAPNARIAVYFTPNTEQGFVDAVSSAIHDAARRPSVVLINWGSPESTWAHQTMEQIQQSFAAAAAMGVTVIAAAGDDGSSGGMVDGRAHVDFPASAPGALACGGSTVVISNGLILSESAWTQGRGRGAGGGGISEVFLLPAYQAYANVPTSVNPGGTVGRGVPDVCGHANPDAGYLVRLDGVTTTVGGTATAASLWAGLIALLNESLGQPVGFMHQLLYSRALSALRDITSGSNGAYVAQPGWDACTGLGSPDGTELLRLLAPDFGVGSPA
jgi:kumamolisin